MENEAASSSVFENGSFERFAVSSVRNIFRDSLTRLERARLDRKSRDAEIAPGNNRAEEEQLENFVVDLMQILKRLHDSCQAPRVVCVLTSTVLQEFFRQDESRRFFARETLVNAH